MKSLSQIRILVMRELYGYFCSPIAYVFLIIFLVLLGFFTFGDYLGNFYKGGVADLERPFFSWHPWLFIVLVPAIGMRMWSEEINSGTLELLGTLPITLWQAVLAKFIAGSIFLLIALACTFPTVITVNYLGDPDNGKIACGYLASLLMGMSFLAISSFTSAMTRNQVISFIVTLVLCLLGVLCGFEPIVNIMRDLASELATMEQMRQLPLWLSDLNWLVDFVRALSVYTHYSSMQRGIIDSRDIIFFLSLIIFGLLTTQIILKNR